MKDGVLAPDGPAYKAIVLLGQTRITPSASAALVKFAQAGLPIFIVGPAPNSTIGAVGQDVVSANMARLTGGGLESVKVIPQGRFSPEALWEAGVLPRLSAEAIDGALNASQLLTTWRSDPTTGTEYVHLLNRGPETLFSIAFSVPENFVPYILDLWTGEQTPVVSYLRTTEGISSRIKLASRQSTVIAFKRVESEDGLPLYAVSHSPNLARLWMNDKGELEGYVEDLGEASALLSDNRQVTIPSITTASTLSSLTLGPWSLSVDSWSAPNTLSTTSVASNRTTITISTSIRELVPWTRIRGLERTSGIGTYRTTFKLPSPPINETQVGYTLHLSGRVLNTIRVFVNGALVPAIDPSAPNQGRDITQFLKAENEVVIEVSSTLFNAVKARMSELRSVGKGVQVPRYYTQPNYAEFGLIGEVIVKQWRKVKLS